MKRADAEQLAMSYCLRNVSTIERWDEISRPQAERKVVAEARLRYGDLTAAGASRIRKRLREERVRAPAKAPSTRSTSQKGETAPKGDSPSQPETQG